MAASEFLLIMYLIGAALSAGMLLSSWDDKFDLGFFVVLVFFTGFSWLGVGLIWGFVQKQNIINAKP